MVLLVALSLAQQEGRAITALLHIFSSCSG